MARNRVPSGPQRRTYQTGQTLPDLTRNYRPIPLGRDENGETDGQIRALAVLIRNRADTPIYIKEGPTADEMEISKGEDYRIWEPNGINSVMLRGKDGGEAAEIRVLEAHNDFDITDKIESFVRSIAHFMGTATRDTVISGQEVDLSIDDAGGISVIGDVDASGSTVDVNKGNITVDDITAANATFDGDITGQSNFDLSVIGRTGQRKIRVLEDTNSFGTNKFWTLYSNSDFDGMVEYISFSLGANGSPSSKELQVLGVALEVDRGNGWERVSPRSLRSAYSFRKYDGYNSRGVNIAYREDNYEINFYYEPVTPITFSEGDSVRIRVGDDPTWAHDSGTASYTVSIEVGTREKIRQA